MEEWRNGGMGEWGNGGMGKWENEEWGNEGRVAESAPEMPRRRCKIWRLP